ncbi:hypothetical protein MHBO_000160 [Bonamia ostreae]|uniref:Uncharacterized protein n=1 Tax=Bonamia ostreae TaxID=126728 RepID=A0ABV2AEM4_9EUKA
MDTELTESICSSEELIEFGLNGLPFIKRKFTDDLTRRIIELRFRKMNVTKRLEAAHNFFRNFSMANYLKWGELRYRDEFDTFLNKLFNVMWKWRGFPEITFLLSKISILSINHRLKTPSMYLKIYMRNCYSAWANESVHFSMRVNEFLAGFFKKEPLIDILQANRTIGDDMHMHVQISGIEEAVGKSGLAKLEMAITPARKGLQKYLAKNNISFLESTATEFSLTVVYSVQYTKADKNDILKKLHDWLQSICPLIDKIHIQIDEDKLKVQIDFRKNDLNISNIMEELIKSLTSILSNVYTFTHLNGNQNGNDSTNHYILRQIYDKLAKLTSKHISLLEKDENFVKWVHCLTHFLLNNENYPEKSHPHASYHFIRTVEAVKTTIKEKLKLGDESLVENELAKYLTELNNILSLLEKSRSDNDENDVVVIKESEKSESFFVMTLVQYDVSAKSQKTVKDDLECKMKRDLECEHLVVTKWASRIDNGKTFVDVQFKVPEDKNRNIEERLLTSERSLLDKVNLVEQFGNFFIPNDDANLVNINESVKFLKRPFMGIDSLLKILLYGEDIHVKSKKAFLKQQQWQLTKDDDIIKLFSGGAGNISKYSISDISRTIMRNISHSVPPKKRLIEYNEVEALIKATMAKNISLGLKDYNIPFVMVYSHYMAFRRKSETLELQYETKSDRSAATGSQNCGKTQQQVKDMKKKFGIHLIFRFILNLISFLPIGLPIVIQNLRIQKFVPFIYSLAWAFALILEMINICFVKSTFDDPSKNIRKSEDNNYYLTTKGKILNVVRITKFAMRTFLYSNLILFLSGVYLILITEFAFIEILDNKHVK